MAQQRWQDDNSESPTCSRECHRGGCGIAFFNGGVQCDQEVKDHDPDWQGECVVVVPVNNVVVVVIAIAQGGASEGTRTHKELAVVDNLLPVADAAAVGGRLERGNARPNRDATEPLLSTTSLATSAT